MKFVVVALTILALWLIGLTVFDFRREQVIQSNSQVLCTDALERRSTTEKVLTGQLTSSNDNAYAAWYAARKVAETQITKNENDVNRFCGVASP